MVRNIKFKRILIISCIIFINSIMGFNYFEINAQQIVDLGNIGTLRFLQGKVVDYNGDPINNATITIDSNKLDKLYTCESDKDGIFKCPDLRPGKYEIRVEASGYDINVFTLKLNPLIFSQDH